MHARDIGGIGILWMQIIKENPGRTKGFDMFEKTLHVGMRGLGRIFIRSANARGIGGIEFWWMQIIEEDPEMNKGFDMFEGTVHVGMRGLKKSFHPKCARS